ncbi:type II toxin-antitoxin system VapC family toxin [Rhodoplanes sp. TEM]|uniref:Ribonuclease VapC n=1 Tax=Rhodoplanes tepidamans TaxID=200616 RepID=A0ABT5JJE3_RHOTP|nr:MULTISPECIES: type II toxin-antitoxin system VapC family toxin [Rhodoplanes]MDC7789855.1 type II toxin-antitoxin system VapC family toxin [Rhodoplanes tepidamans]MDC7987642.1 type II toxin-antitoxin system VapC family toxin [Rhodoplanes sp. TEM]MDQ0358506.1 putative nucleic acid-binding protein [Rhodoplanes tepidamans]
MYLLDTNVVSELRRPDKAHPSVVAWAAQVPTPQVFLSVISILEIEIGASRLARKDAVQGRVLRRWIDETVMPRFADRILPIDTRVAQRCAALHGPDPRPERDAFIAATALVHGLIVVTRNTRDFEPLEVDVLNPWRLEGAP